MPEAAPAPGREETVQVVENRAEVREYAVTVVVMPNVSGRELAGRLEELQPGIKQKPFSPEQLATRVREVLGPPKRPARILVADEEAGVRTFPRTESRRSIRRGREEWTW